MENKLPHTIIGTVISWALTFLTWTAAHAGLIATAFAIIASIFTAMAGWETRRYFRAKRQALERGRDPETE